MWTLILFAVNIFDPSDIPGEIKLKLNTEQECVQTAKSLEYKLKFSGFKVTAECKQY
jgi:hypothetical protein